MFVNFFATRAADLKSRGGGGRLNYALEVLFSCYNDLQTLWIVTDTELAKTLLILQQSIIVGG